MEVGGIPCLRVEVLWRTEVEGALNDVISNEPSNVRRRGSPRSRSDGRREAGDYQRLERHVSMRGRRLRRRSKAERLAARGDVRRLIRLIGKHDWLVDADGHARDLAVGRRIEAVAALGSIESGDAEAGILIALADDDPRVKLAAVEALGSKPSARAARALARAAAAGVTRASRVRAEVLPSTS